MIFFSGNLLPAVSDDDLKQLLGIKANKFLEGVCLVEIVKDSAGKKSKGFAFITVPCDVCTEILKLNGIEFFGRELVIELAKSDDERAEQKEKKNKKKENKGQGNKSNNNKGGNQNNKGKYWRGKGKFDIPNLDADQKLDLIDCGANLTNPK